MASIYGKQPGSNWSDVSSNNVGAQLGGKYQKLVDANPYRNQIYQKSPWQNFLSALGFRTEADAWQENMSVQAAEYDSQMRLMQYQNEYNSPLAEASRMRQAGLNPDLQGIGDVAESAMPGDDPSTPMQSTGAEGTLGELANFCMNAFSTALGLVHGIQGVHSTLLDNTMKQLSNERQISDFAKGLWPYMLPDSPDPSAGDNVDLMANPYDWQAAALKNATVFAGNFPKKFRKRFINEIQQYWSSGPGQAESYKQWKERVQERKGFYSERGTFYSDIDDVLQDIVNPLVSVSEDIFRQRQKAEFQQGVAAENEALYDANLYGVDNAHGLNPESAAKAQNSANDLSTTNNLTVDSLNSTISQIISNLQSTAKNDHGIKGALANVAVVLIAGLRLYLANGGHPSVGVSQGVNKYGNTSSMRLGF